MNHLVASAVREHLAAGRALYTTVTGHSMWPALKDGDAVTIVPLAAPPAIGDVVLIEARTKLVLHRVVAIHASGVTTKGDAEPEPEGPIPWDRILGWVPRSSSRWRAALSRLGGGPAARLMHALRRRFDS